MKVRSLLQFIIYYLNLMLDILVLFFLIKGNGLVLYLIKGKENVKCNTPKYTLVISNMFSYLVVIN